MENIEGKESVIYDVGGATGAYSFWMADNGYNNVTLVDIVPKHIETAKRKAKNHRALAGMIVAYGRELLLEDNSAELIYEICIILL